MLSTRQLLGALLLTNIMAINSSSHASNYDTSVNYNSYKPSSTQCGLDCPGTWVLGVNAGLAWLNTPDNFNIANNSGFPAPNNVDRYTVDNINSQGIFSFLAGYRWQTNNASWLPYYALMLQYRHLVSADLKGSITQFSFPGFTNYDYRADLLADSLSLLAKINLTQTDVFSPYVTGSIGYSKNQIKSYSESARIGITPRVSPGFQKNSQNEFIYSVGIGMDINFTANWTVAIALEHQNQGHFSSGNGTSTNWTNQHINLGSLTSNNALVQVLYHFPTV